MIEVVIGDDGWTGLLPDVQAHAERCRLAASAIEPRLDGDIALLLCDDAEMAGLNRQFRGKGGPTNVLSFPSGAAEGFLGDIALARETCEREAAAKGVPLRDHAAHLIIHGMLHLIGYDHETDDEAAVMERREVEILKALGVADPYAGDW